MLRSSFVAFAFSTAVAIFAGCFTFCHNVFPVYATAFERRVDLDFFTTRMSLTTVKKMQRSDDNRHLILRQAVIDGMPKHVLL